MTYFILRFSF